MDAKSKISWGLGLWIGGKLGLLIALLLSMTGIGACLGIPMALVCLPCIICGVVLFFQGRSETAKQVIAAGVRQGMIEAQAQSSAVRQGLIEAPPQPSAGHALEAPRGMIAPPTATSGISTSNEPMEVSPSQTPGPSKVEEATPSPDAEKLGGLFEDDSLPPPKEPQTSP